MTWTGRRSIGQYNERANSLSKSPASARKRKIKFTLLGLLLVFLGVIGWVSFSNWKAVRNITSDSKTNGSIF